MKRVGRKDTVPELIVRKFLHRHGLRYRLHVRQLPGTPDIVFPRYETIVFVDGCFWYGHRCRHGSIRAKTNSAYWDKKVADNRARDKRNASALSALGWKVERIWECQCRSEPVLTRLYERIRQRRSAP